MKTLVDFLVTLPKQTCAHKKKVDECLHGWRRPSKARRESIAATMTACFFSFCARRKSGQLKHTGSQKVGNRFMRFNGYKDAYSLRVLNGATNCGAVST